MNEDGESGADWLGGSSSRRLRLSILRPRSSRGASRSGVLDSADRGSQGGASSGFSTVTLPSISYRGVEVGVGGDDVRERAEGSDHSQRRSPQNTSFLGADGVSDAAIEENSPNVTEMRQLRPCQQPTAATTTEAGNDLPDIPREVPGDGASQQREVQERQLEDGTTRNVESVPAEPGAELNAGSGGSVGSPQEHDGPLASGEVETDDARQGGDVAGNGHSNYLEQDADSARFQEMEPAEERSLVSQQQDATPSHDVEAFGQSGVLDTSFETVVAHETESASLRAEASNPVIQTVELSSDDDGAAQSEDPTLTASVFAEPRLTAEDFDVFAPEPHLIPKAEAEGPKPKQLGTQLDLEGLTCSICMEPWTSTGNHRICSLACGHLFGHACIKRWLNLATRGHGKCPQCNKRARIADLRTLYVPRIAVIDGESQHYMEEADTLRTENEKLKKQVVDLREEVRHTQALLRSLAGDQRNTVIAFDFSYPRPQDQRGHYRSESRRHVSSHHASRPAPHRPCGSVNRDQSSLQIGQSIRESPHAAHPSFMSSNDLPESRPIPEDQQNWRRFDERNSLGTSSHAGMIVDLEQRREENIVTRPMRSFTSLPSQGLEKGFSLQERRLLNGAKVFDMDAQSQLLLVSGRPPDSITSSGITKMSLLSLSEGECINLPFGTGAIRDIRIAPTGTMAPGRLALVASLGKRLSLFSLETNNVVLTYTLPNPSWACAWDPCNSNVVYTGLQNGTLLTFDIRQTASPLDTLNGASFAPIHTLQYVPKDRRLVNQEFEGGGLLSASSSTLDFWPGIGQPLPSRPVCLLQPGGPSVCVSVSYNAAVDVMVASFRPRPTMVPSNDGASSSSLPTHSQADMPSQAHPSPTPTPTSTPSVSVRIPTHISYSQTTCGHMQGPGNFHTTWEQQGAMVGHKSQAVMSRTAIVNEWPEIGTSAGRSNCLFASGDEDTNSVWLWDLTTQAVTQTLTSHPFSPVVDIRTAHVAGVDLLGCISERTLQLYNRVSR